MEQPQKLVLWLVLARACSLFARLRQNLIDTWERRRRTAWSFSQLLKWHLDRGTRPATQGQQLGSWSIKEFAFAVKHPQDKSLPDRSVRNWLNGESIPSPEYFQNVETALFGSDLRCSARLRTELKDAYEGRKEYRRTAPGRWKRLLALYGALPDKKKGIAQASFVIIGVQLLAIAVYSGYSHRQQVNFQIERDLQGFYGLDNLLRGVRFVEFDCGLHALEAGGMDKFGDSPGMRRFSNALVFREKVVHSFLALTMNAIRQGHDLEPLKKRAKIVAERFSLLTNPDLAGDSFGELYAQALSELKAQSAALKELGIRDEWPAPEEQMAEAADPPPAWCRDPSRQELGQDDFRDLVRHGRVVHGFIAGLYIFAGDAEMAVSVMRRARISLAADINVNAELAEMLSLRRLPDEHLNIKDLDEASELLGVSIKAIKAQAEQVEAYRADTPIDLDIKRKLQERYIRARLDVERTMAFLLAQESTEHPILWYIAQQYAADNYNAHIDRTLKLFPCVDDFVPVAILDIYGYVKMMSQQDRISMGDKLDDRELTDAMSSFKQALAELRKVKSGVCVWQGRRKEQWERRISVHYKQAQAMRK